MSDGCRSLLFNGSILNDAYGVLTQCPFFVGHVQWRTGRSFSEYRAYADNAGEMFITTFNLSSRHIDTRETYSKWCNHIPVSM